MAVHPFPQGQSSHDQLITNLASELKQRHQSLSSLPCVMIGLPWVRATVVSPIRDGDIETASVDEALRGWSRRAA
jgi:hypothetical protein